MAKSTKINTKFFSHDKYMRNDTKIRYLETLYPQCKWYWAYCKLLEILADEEWFEIELSEWKIWWLAFDIWIDIEEFKVMMNMMIEIKLFILEERNWLKYFYSHWLKDRLQIYIDKVVETSNRAKEAANKRWNKESMPTHSEGNANKSKEEENKINESKEIYNKSSQEFFENMKDKSFNSNHICESFDIKPKMLKSFYLHYSQECDWLQKWQTMKGFDIDKQLEKRKLREFETKTPETSLDWFENILASLSSDKRRKVEKEAIKWLESDKSRVLTEKVLNNMIEKYEN